MTNVKSRSKKLFIAISIFVLLMAAAFIFYFLNRKEKLPPPIKEQEHLVPARPSSFEEGAQTLARSLKLARIAIFDQEMEDARFFLDESLLVWRDTSNEYINNPPSTFPDPEKWSASIAFIYENIQASKKDLDQSQVVAANAKIDACRTKLSEIYDISSNLPAEDHLFKILLLAESVSQASSSEIAMPILQELKLAYTSFKDLPEASKNSDKNNLFETVISDIENATLVTFPKERDRLLSIFFSLYREF